MLAFHSLLALLPIVSVLCLPQQPQPPSKALPKAEIMGGIFGIDPLDPNTAMTALRGTGTVVSTGTKGLPLKRETDNSGGSGPFPARWTTHPDLANHTIYAPKTPPPGNIKMPIIVWGNGGCIASGTSFQNFLTEIASYGYLVIASGPPAASPAPSNPVSTGSNASAGGGFSLSSLASSLGNLFGPGGSGGGLFGLGGLGSGLTKATDLTDAIDWATKNAGALTYGSIDKENIAAAGQSCGGLEAYSASYVDARIKQTVVFNSGCITKSKQPLLADLKAPIAYFLGGPTDLGEFYGASDFEMLPKHIAALKASLDVGHLGTYFEKQGGKIGKATVAFFNWRFKGDAVAKALFFDPKSSLVADGWNITTKNFS